MVASRRVQWRSVESSSRLIYPSSDKISRGRCFLVLKKVVALSIGHTANFKPAVEEFCHMAKGTIPSDGWDS